MNGGLDDAILIQRSRQGDKTAFGMLVEKYQDSLFNTVYRMLGNYDDAADAAQDVFLNAFRSIGSFKGSASFRTWLYAIASNTCLSRFRQEKTRLKNQHISMATGGDCEGSGYDAATDNPGPVHEAIRREDVQQLERAIERLPDDMRMVVVLKDIDGFNYIEIAAATGWPVGTVKSKLSRARQMLREMLKS